jgi:hypothetical protein
VAGYIFLIIGGLCAIIGRILLVRAAFGVSVWWGLGVFLPFGPLLFRLSHPGLAPLSAKFRLAVLPCFFMFFLLEPNGLSALHRSDIFKSANAPAAPRNHYATEKVPKSDLAERSAANTREFERLKEWSEGLRLKKRDLLHSDVQGNIAYDAELAQYESALAKATADKQALFGAK